MEEASRMEGKTLITSRERGAYKVCDPSHPNLLYELL